MIDHKRHAPVGRMRRLPVRERTQGHLPHRYTARQRRALPDLYTADGAEARRGARFRWFFSTCLAAAVGGLAIIVVIFGSTDPNEGRGGLLSTLRRMSEQTSKTQQREPARPPGLNWAMPKSDRLQAITGAASTKFIVQESIRQRRGSREYIHNKPYARVLARLGAMPAGEAGIIPPFNPFKLYANPAPVGDTSDEDGEDGTRPEGGEVVVRVVELLGGLLPGEDGQELEAAEVIDLVQRVLTAQNDDVAMRPGFLPEGLELAARGLAGDPQQREAIPPATTVLEKNVVEPEEAPDDLEGRQKKRLKVARGDTLTKLLQSAGAEAWLARGMVEAARGLFPESSLAPGYDVELTMVPSVVKAKQLEPIRLTVMEGGEHKVTVSRNAAGEYVASATPIPEPVMRAPTPGSAPKAASLYASLYQAGLMQGLQPETIEQILRIHAYETDFRRRARNTDSLELFFDLKDDDKGADSQYGELLLTAITTGGETQRYVRFRTPDGHVDYYDEYGSNSKKFLLRRPVRSEDSRLASGFGVRFHPLLNTRKMHTGVDWAASIGTPILAGGNGIVEEVGPKGQYGNYIRLRHANGYQTAYGHMSRFAPGIREGVKVRQGQVIGYVGNTGFSTGPHVHYEVLVNSRFVDPLSIQVPQERKLTGKLLAEFQKERGRIEELMRRPPVRIAQIEAR